MPNDDVDFLTLSHWKHKPENTSEPEKSSKYVPSLASYIIIFFAFKNHYLQSPRQVLTFTARTIVVA